MIKKILFILLIICLQISFGKFKEYKVFNNKSAPSWVKNPIEENYWYFGTASIKVTGNMQDDIAKLKIIALEDLVSKISVTVKSSQKIDIQTHGDRFVKDSYTEQTVLSIKKELSGVVLKDHWFDAKNSMLWSLYTFQTVKQKKISKFSKKLVKQVNNANRLLRKKNITSALKIFIGSLSKIKKVNISELKAAIEDERIDVELIEYIQNRIKSILSKIKIEKISGDNQSALPLNSLSNPFEVKLKWKNNLLKNFPLQMSYKKTGNCGVYENCLITDLDGISRFFVSELPLKKGNIKEYSFIIKPNWGKLGWDISEPFIYAEELKETFTVNNKKALWYISINSQIDNKVLKGLPLQKRLKVLFVNGDKKAISAKKAISLIKSKTYGKKLKSTHLIWGNSNSFLKKKIGKIYVLNNNVRVEVWDIKTEKCVSQFICKLLLSKKANSLEEAAVFCQNKLAEKVFKKIICNQN